LPINAAHSMAVAERLPDHADSTDRRNTLAKAFRRGLEVERLSGSFVHATSDGEVTPANSTAQE